MKSANDGDVFLGTLAGGTQIVAATQDHGRTLLTTEDAFVEAQSRFDRQARVKVRFEVAPVTLPIYLDYVSSQVLPWSPAEIGDLQAIIGAVAHKIAALNVPLPPVVHLVKTTGLEEGYTAYTRKNHVIVLPENLVASLIAVNGFDDPLHRGSSTVYLERVITRQLFHILSKHHPVVRARLYGLRELPGDAEPRHAAGGAMGTDGRPAARSENHHSRDAGAGRVHQHAGSGDAGRRGGQQPDPFARPATDRDRALPGRQLLRLPRNGCSWRCSRTKPGSGFRSSAARDCR